MPSFSNQKNISSSTQFHSAPSFTLVELLIAIAISAFGGPAGGGLPLRRKSTPSFTLVELLIVIAILAVLAAAVVIVLNPAELLAQARDSQRITDMKTLKDSIDIWVVDNPSTAMGTSQTVYVSLPDTSLTCANITSLPSLPSGWQYHCVTEANLQNTDGTGWLPLNLSSIYGGSPIPYLPIDPSNEASSGKYYTYTSGGSYELTALMEAEKENASVADGGSLPGVYELGTHIGLTPPTRDKGLVGYWTFDEGSGTTAYDSSGKGNDGVWSGPSIHYATGKTGPYSAIFNESESNYVDCPPNDSLDFRDTFSLSFWIKGSVGTSNWPHFISKRDGENYIGWQTQIYGQGPDIYLRIDTSAMTNQTSGVLTVLDETWHHAVFVINNGSKEYYLDGVKRHSGSFSVGGGMIAHSTPLHFGGRMIVQLDDVRLFNRSLSQKEVSAIYEGTK